MRVLITGASGFIGKLLCAELLCRGQTVRAAMRTTGFSIESVDEVIVGEISANTDWNDALRNVDVVYHLAARVHVMQESASDPFMKFREVNVDGTAKLARQAAVARVRRFVYLSSVKVNGEQTDLSPFTELDILNPQDPYGVSKLEAEQALHKISAETNLEVVIVRSPLVYGANAKGNFAQMMKVLAKGIPLPLAAVRNLRSLVYIENLVSALILCSTHPNAAGKTYLVSDGEDVSTADLLRQLGKAMGQPARLFACSPALLRLAGRLIGKSEQLDRLLGSSQVDSSKIRRELGWVPPVSFAEGIKKTVEGL